MTLEPKAIELLKAASERLAAARSMSFTAVVGYESASRIGPPLVYTTRSEVLMQRPGGLRVITPGDGPRAEFYYDGKTMTGYAPAEGLAAVADAPPTIDEALRVAFNKAAIYFPFSDLIVADPYRMIAEGLKSAFYVGQSTIVGGVTTDIIALVDDYVFLQMWVGSDDKLPRMIRAVFRDDPQRLRHQLEISDWKLDPPVPESAFTAPATSPKPIAFGSPQPAVPVGARPPGVRKATAAPASAPNR
jgi:hypothetical protein